ncbi:hypothetical protein ACKI16_29635 [Streptomyces scabiei]|uniref:hypothetical protein n=1 Tax=Streptomyces scabiei TaxID=1930 RepID=UPI0038F7A3CE
MAREISTKTPNAVATPPATVEACQGDRANRPGSENRTPSQVDDLRAAEAIVQRGLITKPVNP